MKKMSIGIVAVISSLMMGQTVLATTYDDATNAVSPVTVFIEEDGDPVIPPIDPVDPPITPPINPNPGALSLRYVSGLDFGQIIADGSEQTVSAIKETDSNGLEFENLVSLRDLRSSTNRDGWTLTVKQDKELLEGATITMNPYLPEEVAEDMDISVGGEMILNGASQVFANTNTNVNPSGSVSIGMAQPGEAVSLFIPEGEYEAGEYTTSLTWELVSGPLAE